MRKLLALLLLPLGLWGQTNTEIARWNFSALTGGTGNWGASPINANSSNSKATIGGLTRGSGIGTPGGSSVAGSAWGGAGNTSATTSALAITNNSFYTFTIQPVTGMKLSLTDIRPYNIRRSSTGANTGLWQYSINGSAYTDIGTAITWGATTSNVGNNQPAINLSGITALQNLTTSSTVTFRLLIWGATNATGTHYFNSITNVTPDSLESLRIFGNAECFNQTLAASSATGLSERCADEWTYYGSSANEMLFAIKKNGNTINAAVDLTVNAGSAAYSSSSTSGSNQEHGSYLLGRYWNVSCTGCTYSLGGGVDVRFFYNPTEITNARSSRNSAFSALKTANPSTLADTTTSLEWFKTNSVVFAPNNFTGNKLTVAHTKLTGTLGTLNSVNYVEFTGISSFSGGGGGFGFGPPSGGGGVGLPVTWAGFDASVQRDYTELIWYTASEQNTSHFEVEASEDGKNFKTISENIAAAGNSPSLLSYSFRDMDLAPIKYYRLKQVDIEGTFEYSKIIVAKRSEGEKQDFDLVVYPVSENNNKEYHLLLKNKTEDISAVQIVDYTGKPVFHMTSSKNAELLDLRYLTPGIYMIQVWNGEEKQVERVVVQ